MNPNQDTDPVSIAEIADFLRQLRSLSQLPAAPGPDDAHPDLAAERAAFLTRKADLFARIAARQPDPSPTTTSPTTTSPTTTSPTTTSPTTTSPTTTSPTTTSPTTMAPQDGGSA
jgi:hypothetical protein